MCCTCAQVMNASVINITNLFEHLTYKYRGCMEGRY